MSKRGTARPAAASLTCAGFADLAVSVRALDRPEPQPPSQSGVATETPAEIAEVAPVLTGADPGEPGRPTFPWIATPPKPVGGLRWRRGA